MKQHTLCTLSLALAMSLAPGATFAQSHCKGIAESACSASTACRWQPERKVGDLTKAGKPAKTGAAAHCRLDVKAAAAIAAKINSERQAQAK